MHKGEWWPGAEMTRQWATDLNNTTPRCDLCRARTYTRPVGTSPAGGTAFICRDAACVAEAQRRWPGGAAGLDTAR